MTQAFNDPAADIGPRGLVIYGRHGAASGKFDYVHEATWRELPSYPLTAASGALASLATLNVAIARLEQGVFVDLDQLKQLSVSPAASQVQNNAATLMSAPFPAIQGPTIVLKEFNKLYVVPVQHWSTADVEISGDAAVLINRDAVLAPIPSNPIAEGTFCVLINLAALV